MIDIVKERRFIGTKRQKLTAVKFLRMKNSDQVWLFKCDCGKFKETGKQNFLRSTTNNCGCWHGHSKHKFSVRDQNGLQLPIYSVWVRIRQRCNNPKNPDYKYYGGRGIKHCARWNEFKNFYADMGASFEEHRKKHKSTTIERINNNGSYSPENCRWATRAEQANNFRQNTILTYGGKTQSMSAWAKELPIGITPQNLSHRITGRKWTIERAFTQPLREIRK